MVDKKALNSEQKMIYISVIQSAINENDLISCSSCSYEICLNIQRSEVKHERRNNFADFRWMQWICYAYTFEKKCNQIYNDILSNSKIEIWKQYLQTF